MLGAAGPLLTSSADIYTCPMHPMGLQNHPGTLLICGMALVVRPPTTGTEHGSAELRIMRRRLVVAAILTLPVVLLAMAHVLPGDHRMLSPYFGMLK